MLDTLDEDRASPTPSASPIPIPKQRASINKTTDMEAIKVSMLEIASRLVPFLNTRTKTKQSPSWTFNDALKDIEAKKKWKDAFPTSEAWTKASFGGRGWGKTTFIVSSRLEMVAAFFWDFDGVAARELVGDNEREIEERVGEWEMIVSKKQTILSAHRKNSSHRRIRETENVMKLYKIDRDTVVIQMKPKEGESEGRRKSLGEKLERVSQFLRGGATSEKTESNKRVSAKKATETVTIRLKRRKGMFKNETEVEFVTMIDLGIRVSQKATILALYRLLYEAVSCQRFFAKDLSLEDMTKRAGETLGACMVWDGTNIRLRRFGANRPRRIRKNEKLKMVNSICKESKALREIIEVYPSFEIILLRARLGEINRNR